jgi:hypothetical protein
LLTVQACSTALKAATVGEIWAALHASEPALNGVPMKFDIRHLGTLTHCGARVWTSCLLARF